MAGFKKATKSQAKARVAVFGPSGAGKTFSCLRIASGLASGGRVAVIDTERGSASKYSDRFAFDVLELEDQSIEGYVEAIKLAAREGYDVLIIDSLSHAWQTLLEEVEKLAKAKYRGNTWSAWSEGTPLQRKLVGAILAFPGHVLATMRSKTEWTTVDDGRGKKSPQRVGLAPEQGKGVEYEFDLLVEISTEHIANVIKDRSGKFQDKLIEKPGEEFGKDLAAWLSDGVPSPVRVPDAVAKADQPAGGSAQGAAPSAADLVALVEREIAKAKDVKKLGQIGTRMEIAVSDGRLSTEDHAELLGLLNQRHQEVAPEQFEEVSVNDHGFGR
jgi:hypothetical protein